MLRPQGEEAFSCVYGDLLYMANGENNMLRNFIISTPVQVLLV